MSRVKSFLLTGSLIFLTGCSSHAQEQLPPTQSEEPLGLSDTTPEDPALSSSAMTHPPMSRRASISGSLWSSREHRQQHAPMPIFWTRRQAGLSVAP